MIPEPVRWHRRVNWTKWVQRGAIEIAGILFLFYSNLLMGEFNRSSRHGKTLLWAVRDILTPTNFAIGLATAVFGFVAFESLRRWID